MSTDEVEFDAAPAAEIRITRTVRYAMRSTPGTYPRDDA